MLAHMHWLQMDTRKEGFEVELLSESDITIWEAKLWLDEGSLAQDLRQYARCALLKHQITRSLQARFALSETIFPLQCA